MKSLRLILGDQLNEQHHWFESVSPGTLYVMMEVRSETDYVTHHIQKILGIFGAMRGFGRFLQERGHEVLYLQLDDTRNKQNFTENIRWIIKDHKIEALEYLNPDEYRLEQELRQSLATLGIPVHALETEHFLLTRAELNTMFSGKKNYLMESFYRLMRKRFDILMDGDKPFTGQWNHDQENRKKLNPKIKIPEPKLFEHDLRPVLEMVERCGVKSIGKVDAAKFIWPVTREEALQVLRHFLEFSLPHFGTFQDAMTAEETWLFHSRISFALNLKMLSPLEVIQSAVAEWEKRNDEITFAQIEGFVRQILGWREYMRGIYWAKMPAFESQNFFGHTRKLPSYFWSGKTKMRCVGHAVTQSLEFAYAHHIQRLMITGNFSLLAGIDPAEVDAWYLGIYIDAFQWVELPNTRGMSQFADGGVVATKPYVSSANYIDKMSSYCSGCFYDKKQRVGDRACPFNSLYWDFFARNADKLRGNPRISMAYKNLDRMTDLVQIRAQAKHYLDRLDEL